MVRNHHNLGFLGDEARSNEIEAQRVQRHVVILIRGLLRFLVITALQGQFRATLNHIEREFMRLFFGRTVQSSVE